MFHQVRSREEDLPAQRFLWRGTERSKPPKTLVMDRMIFGAVSSPFSAQEIKNKNAAQFAERYPEAADAIINRHYMDDYLDSCESVAESIQLIKEVITVHGAGGFEIRNFISSSREVLESLPEELRSMKNNNLALQAELPVERTLGLHWDQEDDVFTFRGSCLQDRNAGTTQLVTKREVLRTVMSIFDPPGFLASYLVTAKVLLQDVWRAGIGWNDELPTALSDRWEKWKERNNSMASESLGVLTRRHQERHQWSCMSSVMQAHRRMPLQPMYVCQQPKVFIQVWSWRR